MVFSNTITIKSNTNNILLALKANMDVAFSRHTIPTPGTIGTFALMLKRFFPFFRIFSFFPDISGGRRDYADFHWACQEQKRHQRNTSRECQRAEDAFRRSRLA
jgi:hypothetical protein